MRIEQTGSLPDPHRLLRVHEQELKLAARAAGEAGAQVAQSSAPTGQTGKLRAGISARVTQTRRGWNTTVGAKARQRHDASATVAQVLRWVNVGTGLFRSTPGPKRRIRSRRPMSLPGGRVFRTVAGQHPNAFMARSRDRATHAAEMALQQAHAETARKIQQGGL